MDDFDVDTPDGGLLAVFYRCCIDFESVGRMKIARYVVPVCEFVSTGDVICMRVRIEDADEFCAGFSDAFFVFFGIVRRIEDGSLALGPPRGIGAGAYTT